MTLQTNLNEAMCLTLLYIIYIYFYNNYLVAGGVALDKDGMNNSENDDWLHKNDSYQPMQIGKESLGTIYFIVISFFPRLRCHCIIYVLYK